MYPAIFITCNPEDLVQLCASCDRGTQSIIAIVRDDLPSADTVVKYVQCAPDIGAFLSQRSAADWLIVLESDLIDAFIQAGRALMSEMTAHGELSVLIGERLPPEYSRRRDGEVQSFVLKGPSHRGQAEAISPKEPGSMCFHVLAGYLNGRINLNRVVVRQLPFDRRSRSTIRAVIPPIAVVIPHRHSASYLAAALSSCESLESQSRITCAVGLDLEDVRPYLNLSSSAVALYRAAQSPVGPYAIRQALIAASVEEHILYLDSDDACCSDRLSVLYEVMEHTGADMVGSHELEVNEIDNIVVAYRYPLDVSAVLALPTSDGVSSNAAEPLLHATMLMKKQAFLKAGGLSTNRLIASDSQFMLRASFSAKIVNANAFVYLRRVHPKALTVAEDTRNGNALRQHLSRAWSDDFKRIKHKQLALEESSLVAVHPAAPYEIYKIDT